MFDGLKKFLAEYDIVKIQQLVRDLDWGEVVSTPEVWFVTVPLLVYVVWKRKFRLLLFACSMVAFMALLPLTMPAQGEAVPLNKLLMFIGGSLALAMINLYFLFIRRD